MRESLALEAAADDLLWKRGFDENGFPLTTPIAQELDQNYERRGWGERRSDLQELMRNY